MADQAETLVRQAGDHPVIEYGARIGYGLSGLIHLVIGYLAVKLAWFSDPAQLNQSGALSTLAHQPGGRALMLGMVAGFAALAVFYLADATAGHIGPDSATDRIKSAGKTVYYLALAYAAFSFTRGSGSNGQKTSVDVTAKLLQAPGGRYVVMAIGVAVVLGGAYHVYKGLARRFLKDLRVRPGRWSQRLGMYGYAAKGVALGVVGVLFVIAALHRQPQQAGGLDRALHRLVQQPFGPALLTVVAFGFVAFGLYCFVRARWMRT